MTIKTLQKSSENAIKNCLELTLKDRLVIVTDKETQEIGQALLVEARKITEDVLFLIIEDFAKRPLKDFPVKMKQAIVKFKPNVSIYAAQGKEGELPVFRRPLTQLLADDLGCAHAHMIGITKEVMLDGMATDYNLLYKTTMKVFNMARKARVIKVTSTKGTNLQATFSKNLRWIASHGKIKKEQGKSWQNLPGTETFTCPQSVNGTLVAEILGDYFSEKYGALKKPVTFHIKDSFIWDIDCADKKLLAELKQYLFTSPLGNRVGEFAIGTNTGLTGFIGNLLQDEKFPGIHIAFGHPYPKETGADWDSPTHLDVIPTKVNIWIDSEKIMAEGKFLF